MTCLRDYNKKYELYIATGLALLTLAVYARVAWFDFINFDDPFFVILNENIHAGLTLEGIRWAFTTAHESSWIPLTWISYMLDIQFFGVNPGGHHSVNVLLHTASTLLLFFFLTTTTGELLKSGMVAFLFALHPLHVESVAWVAERKDVLSALFWMLTMLAYVGYVRNSGRLRYVTCLACFSLGLLAKPMLITLPLLFLFLDLWPLGRMTRDDGGTDFTKLPRLLVEKVPFVILTVAVSIVTYMINSTGVITESYTFLSRAGKASTYYIAYLGKMVWPSGLSIFYPVSLYPPPVAKILISVVFLVVVSIMVCLARGSRGYLLTGWMWYIITLLPVIGLVQVGGHSIADRYTYIPLVGIFVMLVWGIPDILGDWPWKKQVLWGVSLVIMVIMAVVTSLQLGHWKNSITIFSHASAVTERNHVAHNNLGYALLEAGRVEESITFFERAIEERPADTFAMFNLGVAYSRLGDYGKAFDAYNRMILFEPRNERAHYAIGLLYLDIGKRDLAYQESVVLNRAGSKLAQDLMKEILRREAGASSVRGTIKVE